MSLFNIALLSIESGKLGSQSFVPIGRVTNCNITQNLQRADTTNLGRGKPLEQRSIINYTPVEFSCDILKTNSNLENILGLTNSTGVMTRIASADISDAIESVKSARILFSSNDSQNYNGGMELKSGVLTNYTLQCAIDSPAKASLSFQFLDQKTYSLSSSRNISTNNFEIVRPENSLITGLQFSGYGITGFKTQSFSLSLSINRASTMYMGERFPVDRPLTDARATLQVQGYFQGFANISGLSHYNDGAPTFGNVSITLTSSCSGDQTTYTLTNPYLESQTYTPQAGGFTTTSLNFSLPIGVNPNDIQDGSVLKIE